MDAPCRKAEERHGKMPCSISKSSSSHSKDSHNTDCHDLVPPQPPLLVSPKLQGRVQDEHVILRAYECSLEKSQIVLVHGKSGCGKTAFCASLESVLEGLPCYVAMERFQTTRHEQVDPALCFALTHLVFQIVEEHEHDLSAIRTALLETIDLDDFGVLSEFIPNLYQLVEFEDEFASSDEDDFDDYPPQVVEYLLTNLLRCLVTVTRRTLVLILDDAHLAASKTIQLLLAFTTRVTGIVLILAGCLEDVPWDAPLNCMKCDESLACTTLELLDLNVQAIDLLLKATVRTRQRTLPLSELILRKTGGNPRHLIEFITMLHDRRLLAYHHDSGYYSWDLALIQSETNVTENVVRNISIQEFHPLVQNVLKVAACLCFRFPKELLRRLAETELLQHHDQIDLISHEGESSQVLGQDHMKQKMDQVIDIAVDGCLLEVASDTELKFTHDSVQHAILATIPHQEGHLLGCRIVTYLQERMEEVDRGNFIVKAIEHLYETGYAQSIDEVVAFCKLALAAARLEVSRRCNFSQGADIVRLAVNLALDRALWRHHYNLALDLYTTSATLESYAGRFQKSNEMVNVVLAGAKTTGCKISVYHVRLENLGAEGRVMDAIEFGVHVLGELGERVPRKPTKAGIMKEFVSVSLARRRHDDDFLSLGKMTNSSKLAALEILRLITHFAFDLSDDWFPLLTLRSMAMTLRWGLSSCSASAVAAYAVLLAVRKEQNESARFGKIAMNLLETLKFDEDKAHTLILLGRLFNFQNHPISEQGGLFSSAVIRASSCSQFHVAATAACCELDTDFIAGVSLGDLSKKVVSLRRQDNQANKLAQTLVLPLFELISSLRHPQYNCVLLSGGTKEKNPSEHVVCSLYFYQIVHAAFFQNWEQTIKLYETFQTEHRRVLKNEKTHVMFLPMMFHVGVAYFATVSSHPSRLKNGKAILREVKSIAEISPRLSFARLCYKMLDAEHIGLIDRSDVYSAFDDAMAACRDYEYLHYEAFAAERAGMLLLDMNLVPAAKQYLGRGRSLYKDWGALGKVHAIEVVLQSLGKDRRFDRTS